MPLSVLGSGLIRQKVNPVTGSGMSMCPNPGQEDRRRDLPETSGRLFFVLKRAPGKSLALPTVMSKQPVSLTVAPAILKPQREPVLG